MKKRVKNVGLALTAVAIGAAAWRGATVPFSEQWPLYEALRNTAAIIFAVIGAWLAIVYPERLKVSLRSSDSRSVAKNDENSQRVVTLMAPIVHSTFILAAVLVVGITAPLVKELVYVRNHIQIFRGISYGILTALTLWQLWTVVLTLVPASEVTDQAKREDGVDKTVNSVLSRAAKKEKKK